MMATPQEHSHVARLLSIANSAGATRPRPLSTTDLVAAMDTTDQRHPRPMPEPPAIDPIETAAAPVPLLDVIA